MVRTLFVALGAALVIASVPAAAQSAPFSPAVPNFGHIFIIVLENHEYGDVIGSPQLPYRNSLATIYGLATASYGVAHPSLPNYLALTGGDTFGVNSDCTDCFIDAPNLVDQLEKAGKSWRAYLDGMPTPCFLGNDGLYAQKHNPFIYYDDVRTNPDRCGKIVPFTEFASDLKHRALPDFVWITPDQCRDMHSCPPALGDAWLKTQVSQILASPAWKEGGALFITFGEGASNDGCCGQDGGGHIATLVISPLVAPGTRVSTPVNHYALLRTIEDAWSLPHLGGAANAASLAGLFPAATPSASRAPSGDPRVRA